MDFKKLIFVSGKGGVGKSTISLSFARRLHLEGRRVLLVELGERSSLRALTGQKRAPGYQPETTEYGFSWSLLRGRDCMTDYLNSYIKVESLSRYVFENPVAQNLLEIAPGLEDLAILGKLTSGLRKHGPSFDFDHIVVDAQSTGSFTSMLRAPRVLSEMVSSGPLYSQSHSIDECLFESSNCQFIFLSLLEPFPMEELQQSTENFSSEFSSKCDIVINKVFPDLGNPDPKFWGPFLEAKILQQKKIKEEIGFRFREEKIFYSSLHDHLMNMEKP